MWYVNHSHLVSSIAYTKDMCDVQSPTLFSIEKTIYYHLL